MWKGVFKSKSRFQGNQIPRTLHDLDRLFRKDFLETLANSAVQSVKLPPRSLNLNAHAECFFKTIKQSCLEQKISFEGNFLRKVLHDFVVR